MKNIIFDQRCAECGYNARLKAIPILNRNDRYHVLVIPESIGDRICLPHVPSELNANANFTVSAKDKKSI